MRFLLKILLTAVVVAGVTELGKRVPFLAAVLASLPLTSALALTWIYLDTHDSSQVSALSVQIFWITLPSLIFFMALPLMLRKGLPFFTALAVSSGVTAICYYSYMKLLRLFSISV